MSRLQVEPLEQKYKYEQQEGEGYGGSRVRNPCSYLRCNPISTEHNKNNLLGFNLHIHALWPCQLVIA
jgi:hypothetical protein